MKKCPYCAEEIQDEAIKCRYCFSDLTAPPPATAATTSTEAAPTGGSPPSEGPALSSPEPATSPQASPGAAAATQVHYTHSGHRYVLGYGADFFGIWDRTSPGAPADRYERTDDGWRRAWTRFASMEPHHTAVPQTDSQGTSSPAEGAPDATATGAASDNDALQYTHSGQRYLLGYGRTFFGIWDRTAPTAPVERFGRDDAGWQRAWQRFTSLETHYTEVGLGGTSSSAPATGGHPPAGS